jgi:hypothetical protein
MLGFGTASGLVRPAATEIEKEPSFPPQITEPDCTERMLVEQVAGVQAPLNVTAAVESMVTVLAPSDIFSAGGVKA